MSIYTKIGEKILANPNIIRPHVKTKDISQLNFKKMKDMGMEKIIFSKDNTLTLPGKSNFINDGDSISFKNAIEVFRKENTWVVTDMLEIKPGQTQDYFEEFGKTAQTFAARDYDWPHEFHFWKE